MAHIRGFLKIDHEFHNVRVSALNNALEMTPYIKDTAIESTEISISNNDVKKSPPTNTGIVKIIFIYIRLTQ